MAIRIAAVSSAALSDDKKEILVQTTGRYTGALELRFASECVNDLIAALTRAQGGLPPTSPSDAQPALSAMPVPPSANAAASSQKDAGARGNPDQVRFEIPKNCTVTADTSGRGLVLFIVNHKLERQAGYAFPPDGAKQLAGGLIKSADALLAQGQAMPKA